MLSRNHLIAGIPLGLGIANFSMGLLNENSTYGHGFKWLEEHYQNILDHSINIFLPEHIGVTLRALPRTVVTFIDTYLFGVANPEKFTIGLAVIIPMLFFAFGTVLPDVDNGNSKIARRLKLDGVNLGAHRGLTHTNWIPLLLTIIALGSGVSILFWLAFGIWIHLFLDSLSKGGLAPWYPLGKWGYVDLGDTKLVVPNRKSLISRLISYKVGSLYEYVLTGIIAVMGVILCAY